MDKKIILAYCCYTWEKAFNVNAEQRNKMQYNTNFIYNYYNCNTPSKQPHINAVNLLSVLN